MLYNELGSHEKRSVADDHRWIFTNRYMYFGKLVVIAGKAGVTYASPFYI